MPGRAPFTLNFRDLRGDLMRERADNRLTSMGLLLLGSLLALAGCNEEPMQVEDVMGWWAYQYDGRIDTTAATAYVFDPEAILPPDVPVDVTKGVQLLYQDGVCSEQINWWLEDADSKSISIGVYNPGTGTRAVHVWKDLYCPGMFREIWKFGLFRQGDCMARVNVVAECPE